MRIFKALRFFHNRTKSDSALLVRAVPTAHHDIRPLSTPDEQVLIAPSVASSQAGISTFPPADHTTATLTVVPIAAASSNTTPTVTASATLRECLQNLAFEVLDVQKNKSFHKRISALESDITGFQRGQLTHSVTEHIAFLKQERGQLSATIQTLLNTITELGEEASTTRCELYNAIRQGDFMRQQVKADEDDIQELQQKVVQYSKFIGLLVDIGLQEAVLSKAGNALCAGHDADEALVDAIKEAAAIPGSPWSKIMPAITGPRTSDEYLSAIQMTLDLRRQLRESKKLVKFWKRTAQQHAGEDFHTITPSPSNISSIHEELGEERQNAANELLAKLRSGTYPRTARQRRADIIPERDEESIVSSSAEDTTTCLTSFGEDSVSSETDITTDTTSTTCDHVSDRESESGSCTSSSTGTIRPSYACRLPPLASESFKEELCSTESYRHISPSNSSKTTSRIPLGNLDMNCELKRPKIQRADPKAEYAPRPLRKGLGKRRAIVITPSIESIKVRLLPKLCHSRV